MTSLKNCLIIIGSTLSYNFHADYIKQTAEILADRNTVIVFQWGDSLSIKELIVKRTKHRFFHKNRGVLIFTPVHFFPFRRFELIKKINLFINFKVLVIYLFLKRAIFLKKILWVFNYELYYLPKIAGSSFLSLYDYVEYSSSLNLKTEKNIRKKERQLIKHANYFFVDSPTLKKIHNKNNPIVVPQGFDLETFKKFKNLKPIIKLPKNKPIIGYIGNISSRLDFKLLLNLIRDNPQWNFIFIGQKQKTEIEDKYINTEFWLEKIFKLKNVYYFPNQRKRNLPSIINGFSVCLIPYNTNIKFNLYSRAMKMYEYFYMGKSVISTPILESLRLKQYIKIGNNATQFEKIITKLLTAKTNYRQKKLLMKLCLENSWEMKINEITKQLII